VNSEEDANRLAAQSLAAGDATGWFEKLYAEAETGSAVVPWDSGSATALLVEWAAPAPAPAGQRALVVGAGLGRDAEFVAGLGYATTAFDISETAVRLARARYPRSEVTYVVADLFQVPTSWRHGYDLVVESNTVQALPRDLRARATAAVADLVAPGGTLLVLAAAASSPDDGGPPWPLTRAELDGFTTGGLTGTSVEEVPHPDDRLRLRWRALFRRP
jgi:SAM-dependent methyltransferase